MISQSHTHTHTLGQYNGKSKPLPEYHAKISGFDGKILVLSSMRKPKRLTIIGDDTKEYMFLVKGGEDLRHDQRIEQVGEQLVSVCVYVVCVCVYVCLLRVQHTIYYVSLYKLYTILA